jgi:uncharacterized membrane protein
MWAQQVNIVIHNLFAHPDLSQPLRSQPILGTVQNGRFSAGSFSAHRSHASSVFVDINPLFRGESMNLLVLILRLIHILGGVLWVGGALAMNFFVVRTIGATGDAGKQFAGYLMGKTKFSQYMMYSGIASIVAGFILYGIDSNWFTSAWQSSGPGIGFGVGALFALVGMVTGIMNGNNNRAMGQLGAQIQGKPTAEQAAKISSIQRQQAWVIPVNTYSLLIALLFMAVARYLQF